MEYIELGGGRGDMAELGRNLALMHLAEPAVCIACAAASAWYGLLGPWDTVTAGCAC